MKLRQRIIQSLIIGSAHVVALILLAVLLDGLKIQSVAGVIGVSIVYVFSQLIYWWLFINFFSWLPVWLYPLITFILAGGIIGVLGNLIPGILIADFRTAIWITMTLTSISAILSSLFSLDVDSKFDKNVTQKLVSRRINPLKTDAPGLIFLEIDGLSEKLFRQALAENYVPTLKRWLEAGTHKIMGWETEFSSQTGAMQAGVLMGNNQDVPAYRWWDRYQRRIVKSGDPRDSAAIEARLSNGKGLLTEGGASRGNMFSGEATESLFTSSTLLDRSRGTGPGFYLYLVSPFVIARLAARFFLEVGKEWWQAWRQKLRKDRYIVSSRNFVYGFIRAVMGPFLQDLTTYVVINDALRGLPAIYALYAGYDDIAHIAGMESPEAFKALTDIDRYFARIEGALRDAPRPYHIVVLSDHGQSTGPTFKTAYGISLEQLVKCAINGDSSVYVSLNTNEDWDKINVFLNESINANTRTARVLRTMLHSRTQGGIVTFGPDRNVKKVYKEETKIKTAQLIVLASGCVGLIYFVDSPYRVTYEEIQSKYPDLILSLVKHPGIGFVLVRSVENGDIVLGKEGIYFLDQEVYEGKNPLGDFSPNSPAHLKRESSFNNCPDIIVNTLYDPLTDELCNFENQVSHHGGLGGLQNYPFIFYPAKLPAVEKPVVGAMEVHRVLRSWREKLLQFPPSS